MENKTIESRVVGGTEVALVQWWDGKFHVVTKQDGKVSDSRCFGADEQFARKALKAQYYWLDGGDL